MSWRRRFKRFRKKSRFSRRRFGKRARKGRINRRITKIKDSSYAAKSLFVKLKLEEVGSQSNTTYCIAALSYYTTTTQEFFQAIVANGPYSSGIAGAGQPTGFDQYMAFYKKYVVLASKIVVKAFPEQNSAGSAIMFLYPSNEVSLTSNPQSPVPMCRMAYVGPSNGTPVVKLKNFATTKKVTGQKDPANDDAYFGTSTSNPANPWYWNIRLVPLSTTQNVNLSVTVTYFIKFFERQDLPGS